VHKGECEPDEPDKMPKLVEQSKLFQIE
jgi:hypothetical protein